jgi:hypothetical protein
MPKKTLAGQSYYLYGEKVYRLMSPVEAAYEHARGQRKNNVITGLWDLMRNPQGNRLGGFMTEWRREGRLSAQRIETVKKWVEEDFETIIKLEKTKSKKLGKIAIKK